MKNCAKTDETVNEFFEKLTNKNAKLLAAVTLYRYISELDIIEEALYTNKPVSTDGKNKVHRVIMDNTVNAYRKMKTQGYDEKKRICSANMTAFESKCLCDGIKLPEISENSIAKMFADFFEDDKFGIRKICFSIILCLNDSSEDYGYFYGGETLKKVSSILFGDENRIENVREKFFENFKEISSGSFWEKYRKYLIGIGLSMLVAVIFGSAFFGSAAVLGLGGLAVADIVKYEKVKEAFKKLKPDDVAALFAMKATLLGYAIPAMGAEKGKKELDECLSNLNDYRADMEYMLIVEKSGADDSRRKIQICNRFVDRLALIAAK